MIKRVINRIRTYLYKIKQKSRKIKIGKHVRISMSTVFEDNIRIWKNTNVANSFIGRGTIIGWNSTLSNAKIGRFCSIAPHVEIIYGTHPVGKFISTHPAFYSLRKQAGFTFTEEQRFNEYKKTEDGYSVLIGNDVWIGNGASLLEGIKIGDGAIIGANATVTKDIEPYSINVGVPSRKVGYRFEKEDIELLNYIKWWGKDLEWIKENAHYFQDIKNINIIKSLSQ